MAPQVKSRQRVQDHGEVFTNEREVNAMLDMVKQETERIDSRFLEPACGDGNFLAEVLRRKLAVVNSRYRRSLSEDSSLVYTGINKHEGERVGLFDTSLSEFDYLEVAQHDSMITPQGYVKASADGTSVKKNARPRKVERVAPQPAVKVDIPKCDARRKAAPMREATASSTPAKPEAKAAPLDWVAETVAGWGVEIIDKRKNTGNLWVLGGHELDAKMDELVKLGGSPSRVAVAV